MAGQKKKMTETVTEFMKQERPKSTIENNMDKALACTSLAKKYVKSNDGISALVNDSNENGNTNSSAKCNRPVLCELKNEKSIKMLMLVKKNLRNENNFSHVYINSHKTKLQRDILLEKRKNFKNFTSKITADSRLPPVGYDNLSQAKSMNTNKSASKSTAESRTLTRGFDNLSQAKSMKTNKSASKTTADSR
ncbi:hypothetical protein BpHYR1_035102, partial [Brachionus plicatilis]